MRSFANDIKGPWKIGAFNLQVGCRRVSGGFEESGFGEGYAWGSVRRRGLP